jgi:hypothetical protein
MAQIQYMLAQFFFLFMYVQMKVLSEYAMNAQQPAREASRQQRRLRLRLAISWGRGCAGN